MSAHRITGPAKDRPNFSQDSAPVAQLNEKLRASPAPKTAAGATSGFTPLSLPALSHDDGRLSVSAITIPAVLAAGHTQVALTPAQKAGLEVLADDFAERAGEPPADISEGASSAFAVNAYIAATEADFLIRQRYGHRAYVQMQMEAYRASLSP